jgi:formylglycine-generating enzyme required for sulfatase activity
MAHDVFISHSAKDKAVADAVCAALENAGIRCWIGPRDVQPGRSFGGEIARAIKKSEAMVLIFSAHSNNSDQVLREVQLATDSHLHIIQFRIEEVLLNDDLSYFLSTPHWLDALTPPLENHLDRLKTSIRALLGTPAEQSVTAAASTEAQAAAGVPERFVSASSSFSEKRDLSAKIPRKQEVSTPGNASSPPVNRGRKLMLAGAIVALLTVGVLGGWWFGIQQPRREVYRQEQLTEQREKDQRDKEAEQARLGSEKKADAEKEPLVVQQRANEEEPKKKEDSLGGITAATKAKPYENTLGMKFVPVPITGGPTSGKPVLFSVWETRVRDFAQFVDESDYNMKKGDAAYTLEPDGKFGPWKQAGGDWRDPHFPAEAKQTEDHPVVCVSWEDAVAFSEWLTEREHRARRLPAEWGYRLPSDHEWSCAVGIGGEENASDMPAAKDGKVKNVYPWGKAWPPPRGAGNYCGEESRIGVTSGKSWEVIEGYRDGAPRTSVAGQYGANEYGIYDLGGNVSEWCSDKGLEGKWRVRRGASWSDSNPYGLLSSYRGQETPAYRNDVYGFRLVVAGSSPAR